MDLTHGESRCPYLPAEVHALRPLDRVELPVRSEASSLTARAISAARQRSSSDSRSSLDELLPGILDAISLGRGDFLVADTNLYARRAWQLLDDLSRFHDMARPHLLVLGASGEELPYGELVFKLTRAFPDRLVGALRHGLGLLFNGVESRTRTFMRLADLVERSEGLRARIDIAVIPSEATIGLPPSELRTLAFVVEGEAQLSVETGTGSRDDRTIRLGEGRGLSSGDRISIRTADSLLMLLLIRFPDVTLPGIGHLVMPMAALHPLFRADLPADMMQEIRSYDGTVLRDRELLDRELRTLMAVSSLRRGIAWHLAGLPSRSFGSTAQALQLLDQDGSPDWLVRCPLTGGFVFRLDEHPESGLAGGGSSCELDYHLMSTLAELSDGRTRRVGNIEHSCPVVSDSRCLAQLVAWAANIGWLELVGIEYGG